MEGRSFEEFQKAMKPSKRIVASLVLQISEAIDSIHAAGWRHGELRPSSVRFLENGRPQILDFGLSELLVRENALRRSDDIPGHPSYLAPEQLRDPESVDFRADLYGLGALLYSLATGRHPFDGSMSEVLHSVLHESPKRPSTLREDGDRAFDFVCAKLMNKEPESRYASCSELCQKLREIAEED